MLARTYTVVGKLTSKDWINVLVVALAAVSAVTSTAVWTPRRKAAFSNLRNICTRLWISYSISRNHQAQHVPSLIPAINRRAKSPDIERGGPGNRRLHAPRPESTINLKTALKLEPGMIPDYLLLIVAGKRAEFVLDDLPFVRFHGLVDRLDVLGHKLKLAQRIIAVGGVVHLKHIQAHSLHGRNQFAQHKLVIALLVSVIDVV